MPRVGVFVRCGEVNDDDDDSDELGGIVWERALTTFCSGATYFR